MNIRDIVSTEFETLDGDARASELEGTLRETGAKAVVVTEDGEYEGVVTPARLNSAHLDPDAKVRGLVWHVGKVDVDDDVRRVARLMVGSNATVLPVFDGDDLRGVITAEALLAEVQPYLRVLSVEDVYSGELVSISPETTLGEVLHTLRERRITHLPVVEGSEAVGIVSIYDVLEFTTREMQRGQGGSPAREVQTGGGRSHGGFGERAGDLDRMLELPAEDVMTTPVETTTPDERLDAAVGTMLDAGISSLVVTVGDDPDGIVTVTDVLRSLTWTDDARLPVQITNVDLLDDINREGVSELIEDVTRKYGDLSVLEANVYLHEHDETLRGTPLIMARIRLFTDRGHFVGTGEGYGASHALHLARNVLERSLLKGKEYGRTKKHPPEEEWSKVFGWWLTGSTRRR
ncbi:CBS domain-containing protein [Halorarum salinum]|uniref:CBS domain-containing protein n=1 Tax=Halorarum salinum TaxID=2743089 RepID=A0A7D5L9D7_9EURY|nr:CBS domain-containing protein [Halobaculum salinum]QLG61134.1 CBS domain-containing protein [Halobaculum salinum]